MSQNIFGKRFASLYQRVNRLTASQIFWFGFVFSCVVTILIQFIILPYVVPQWHAGDGLLVSNYDSRAFHQAAVQRAQRIHNQGWEAWDLRQGGETIVGIVSAIYALTVPQPWVLIPIQAALHALAALLLWKIVFSIAPKPGVASLAIVPFVVFPTAMQWYAQIHKDGFAIAGILLALLGWILIFAPPPEGESIGPRLLSGSGLVIAGVVAAWIPRTYIVILILAGSGITLLIALAFYLIATARGRRVWQKWDLARFAVAGVLVAGMVLLVSSEAFGGPLSTIAVVEPAAPEPANKEANATGEGVESATEVEVPSQPAAPDKTQSLIVQSADRLLNYLYRARRGYTSAGAIGNTSVDVDVRFTSLSDALAYLPRATQIAFLAPFPSMWLGEGSSAPTTAFRKVVGMEMIIVYISLVGLTCALARWRGRVSLWVSMAFAYSILLPMALVVANIGTLHRFRYGALMVFVAIGLAGLLDALQRRSAQTEGS